MSLTILTTLLRFVKGFVLMRFLSLTDLGIITLVSAIMGLFTMLQVGLLNGGYRIYSEEHSEREEVNNIIYTYFGIIQIIAIIVLTTLYIVHKLALLEFIFAILASFFGVLLVLNNWIRNRHIAAKKVSEVNRLNLISTAASFIFLFTVPFWGLYGALLVTFSIELIFFLLANFRSKELLPTKINVNLKQYRWILSYGFLPFISGVILTYNMQIETWSIAKFLSTEALGMFYLPKLYISLFLLIPTAVSQLFYPDAIRSYRDKNRSRLVNVLKKYFAVNITISVFLIIISYFFMEAVITLAVPKHIVGIPYIWIILPGLIIYTIFQPLDLMFYASNILKPFLYASIIAVMFTTSGFLIFGFTGNLSLDWAALIKTGFYIIIVLSTLSFYLFHKKRIWREVL